jgi:hypothetical protein
MLTSGNRWVGFLEKGDIILSLDGVPIRGPTDVLNHFGWTTVDAIDVRTNGRMIALTVIP